MCMPFVPMRANFSFCLTVNRPGVSAGIWDLCMCEHEHGDPDVPVVYEFLQ